MTKETTTLLGIEPNAIPHPEQVRKTNRLILYVLLVVYVLLIFTSFVWGMFWAGDLASSDVVDRGQTGGCISGVLIRAVVIADNDISDELKRRESVVELPDYCYLLLAEEQPDALQFFYDIGGRTRGESRNSD